MMFLVRDLWASPKILIPALLLVLAIALVVGLVLSRRQANANTASHGPGHAPHRSYKAEFRRKGTFGAKLDGLHCSDLSQAAREQLVHTIHKNLLAKGLDPSIRLALTMHEGCIQLNARYWILGPTGQPEPVDIGMDASEVIAALPDDARDRVTHALVSGADSRMAVPRLVSMEPSALPSGRASFSFRASVVSTLSLDELQERWRPAVGLAQTFERLLTTDVRWSADGSGRPHHYVLEATCPTSSLVPQLLHLVLEAPAADTAAPSAPGPIPSEGRVIISNTVGVPLIPQAVIDEVMESGEMVDDISALLDLSATPARRPEDETNEYLGVARRMTEFAASGGMTHTEAWLKHFLEPEILRFCGRPLPRGSEVSEEAARMARVLQGSSMFLLEAVRFVNKCRRNLGLLVPVPHWIEVLANRYRRMHMYGPVILQLVLVALYASLTSPASTPPLPHPFSMLFGAPDGPVLALGVVSFVLMNTRLFAKYHWLLAAVARATLHLVWMPRMHLITTGALERTGLEVPRAWLPGFLYLGDLLLICALGQTLRLTSFYEAAFGLLDQGVVTLGYGAASRRGGRPAALSAVGLHLVGHASNYLRARADETAAGVEDPKSQSRHKRRSNLRVLSTKSGQDRRPAGWEGSGVMRLGGTALSDLPEEPGPSGNAAEAAARAAAMMVRDGAQG